MTTTDHQIVSKTAEDIDEAYSSPPWWYDLRGVCILTLTYKQTIDMVVKFFAKNIANKHIEVACGTGTLLKLLIDWRKNHRLPKSELIVGLDYAESMIKGAQKRFKNKKNMVMIKGDAMALPYLRIISTRAISPMRCIAFPTQRARYMKPSAC